MTRETAKWNYEHANNNGELWQVYGRCSSAKYHAMDHCKNLQAELNGFDGRITSYNTFQFSYAFQFVDQDSGVIKLMYITKEHNRVFDY